ncbi:MAG: helicase [Microbacterium sp.]
MAGTALAAGMVASTAVLMLGLAAVGGAAAESQRVAGIADAAALAAADAASGAVSGDPCELAAEVAGISGAIVASCTVEGLIATVEVRTAFDGFEVAAAARAGPPPA